MDPRYPVGKYQAPADVSPAQRAEAIREIAAAPQKIRAAVNGLSDAQLDTPYRDGGWTVRQVVHHLADSHMNAYIRWRLALTESEPTIKPYEESAWAKLEDAAHAPVEVSLKLLEPLHERWVRLLHICKRPRICPYFPSSRPWRQDAGLDAVPVRLARKSPHRAHHRIAQTEGLVARARVAESSALV